MNVSLRCYIVFCAVLVCSVAQDSLVSIFKSHRGRFADKWENYIYVYEYEFEAYRKTSSPVNILELGVSFGGSLQIWKKYFGAESTVVGVDIDPDVCNEDGYGDGIYVYCFDAVDISPLQVVLEEHNIDIIIDDASHISKNIITTFEAAFRGLRPGGLYIVEDISTSYWTDVYGGGMRHPGTTIEYFKLLVDDINHLYAYDINSKSAHDAYMGRWIDHIKFEDGLIIIKKRHSPRVRRNARVFTGNSDTSLMSAREMQQFREAERCGLLLNTRNLGLPEHEREYFQPVVPHVEAYTDYNGQLHMSQGLKNAEESYVCIPVEFMFVKVNKYFCFPEFSPSNEDDVHTIREMTRSFCIINQISDTHGDCEMALWAHTVEYMERNF
mmetsp:Transcript_8434/g.12568  ORF Transcript_8434/g.12568 Transcript_8434/m.12568 type:complete len:383 (-) Transcript_8434:110-1258(-)